jgi:osmoprotectant transport system ATP-binding protein
VGADRALKRLALTRVKDLPEDAFGSPNGGPDIRDDASLRDALSDLLQHGALHGNVVDADGRQRGSLTVETLARLAQS